LEFRLSTVVLAADLARRITGRVHPPPLPWALPAAAGVTIRPSSRLTLFHGTPRGPKGNIPLMLDQPIKGFGGMAERYHRLVLLVLADHLVIYGHILIGRLPSATFERKE
jgi:hypothetical protein